MKRRLETAMSAWFTRRNRKPLVLRGARQVGKTHLVRRWAQGRGLVELNLEREPALHACFKGNDPKTILRRVEAATGRIVRADGEHVLFLDEVQAAPELLAKLRWFAEELPRLPVIAAGSLLDFTLADHAFSMPVGRISYLHLEPMGFFEFLEALGEPKLASALDAFSVGDDVIDVLHDKLVALFREWLLVGGMPAVVEEYRQARSLVAAATVQRDLLATLRDDFAKYASRAHRHRLIEVLASVPRQLGKKFVYAAVDRGERAASLEHAVELLCLARVCHRVRATTATGVPLAAGVDERFFKLVSLDTGLASVALGLDLAGLEATDVTLSNEGAIAEQAAAQLLRLSFSADQEPELFYWRRGERGSEAEVDYVMQHRTSIVPVEVKAGKTGTLKSLHALMSARRWKRAVRANMARPSVTRVRAKTTTGDEANYELLSIPLYLVEQLPRLLA